MIIARWVLGLTLIFGVFHVGLARGDEAESTRNWPHWRGPLMNGWAPDANPPLRWSEKENVTWKVEVPGLGHSSPVIWGDQIYLTTSVPVGPEFEKPILDTAPGAHDNLPVRSRSGYEVICLKRLDGRVVWTRRVLETIPHEGGHVTGSLASPSPVLDSNRVYAFFGSRGLFALSHDGEVLWSRDFGVMASKHGHGEGGSPVLSGSILVIPWDHEGKSKLFALDTRTGETLWEVNRDEPTSWCSPILVEFEGKRQVVMSGTKRIRGYDLETGKVIWEAGGLSNNVVASPVYWNGVVVAGSSYEKQAMLAVDLSKAQGDVTSGDAVLWRRNRSTPYVPSPLVAEGNVYFFRHYQNVLSRVDIRTGADLGGPFRLNGLRDIYSSPVGVPGRIYLTSREGRTLVLTTGESPEVLSVNVLEDTFSASAALVNRELYLRGEHFLYRIEED